VKGGRRKGVVPSLWRGVASTFTFQSGKSKEMGKKREGPPISKGEKEKGGSVFDGGRRGKEIQFYGDVPFPSNDRGEKGFSL